MDDMVEALKFATWLGENHFKMEDYDTMSGMSYWRSESYENKLHLLTELYDIFKKEQ